jgi:hypothetical protein
MLLILSFLAFAALILMAATPAIAVHALRFQARARRLRSVCVGAYYVWLFISVMLSTTFGIFLGLAALMPILLALVGPILAMGLLKQRPGDASTRCRGCGYDLTGNTSGRCSECGGTDTVEPSRISPAVQRMRRFMFRGWLGGLCAAYLAAGWLEFDESFYCVQCARVSERTTYGFAPLLVGTQRFLWRNAINLDSAAESALVRWLDPKHSCTHDWNLRGPGLLYGQLGIHLPFKMSPPYSVACDSAQQAEFGEFLDGHPDVLVRIRASLRAKERVATWLDPEFEAWFKSTR